MTRDEREEEWREVYWIKYYEAFRRKIKQDQKRIEKSKYWGFVDQKES